MSPQLPPLLILQRSTIFFGNPSDYVWDVDDLGQPNIRQAKAFHLPLSRKRVLKGADFNLYEPEGDLVRVQRTGGNVQYIRPLRGGDPYKKNCGH